MNAGQQTALAALYDTEVRLLDPSGCRLRKLTKQPRGRHGSDLREPFANLEAPASSHQPVNGDALALWEVSDARKS